MALDIDRKTRADKIVCSRAKQADPETAQTLDSLVLWDEEAEILSQREAETNQEEKTGTVEPTDIDVIGYEHVGVLSKAKATPDAVAFLLKYGLSTSFMSVAGIGVGSARRHQFKLLDYPDEPYYFSAGVRKGGDGLAAPADYRRHVGAAIGRFELRCVKGEFCSVAGNVVGTGRYDDAIKREVVTGVDLTAGTMVISSHPSGALDSTRATHIHLWVDEDGDGKFEREALVAVYDSGTNTVTFTNPPGTAAFTNLDTSVEATYWVDSVDEEAWQDEVVAATAQEEFKLKSGNMRIWLRGDVDSSLDPPARTTDTGQVQGCELDEFAYIINRNATARRCWRTDPVLSDDFAKGVEQGDVEHRLEFNRQIRDWILKNDFQENAAFGVEINAVGPAIDGEAGIYYGVWGYFPYVKILNKPQDKAENRHRDVVEAAVLKDPTNPGMPTASWVVQNKVTSYTA